MGGGFVLRKEEPGGGGSHTPGLPVLTSVLLLVMVAASCSTSRKLSGIVERELSASINLHDGPERGTSFRKIKDSGIKDKDTITVNIDGRDMLIMKAVRDDDTGEMVATEQINAAVVTARFRNVAERGGKVDLQFEIRVPSEMYDPKWQLRFYPDMFVMDDSLRLESVIITGEEYRRAQLRGYQQYEKFISRIVDDPMRYVDIRSLEIFLERNIPQVYAFKSDTTVVSDEQFESCFGVTDRQALEHYTNKFGVYLNERRKSMRSAMYARYVKAPIDSAYIRLDTVMRAMNGDFCYLYTESLKVRPGLRKVGMSLSGDIFEQDRRLYRIPESAPLTFYISSLSSLVDDTEKYLTTVTERAATANAAWNIDFQAGKSEVIPELGDNFFRIRNIKENLSALLTDDTFDLDSITIAAFASPEGSVGTNNALSERRAESVARYFSRYVRHVQDSISRESGYSLTIGDDMSETFSEEAPCLREISFHTSPSGENWELLDYLVERDTTMDAAQKRRYSELSVVEDRDLREMRLREESCYAHIRDELYPLLRTVRFNFFLHRKGMVKDTVHTTVLDSAYMKGVQAIRDRDYPTAVALLSPYNDLNTAIAYLSLDRNQSARAILEKLPPTAGVNYMMAVLDSRLGDDAGAVQCYLRSCRQEPSFVHRGNLDPEISALIRKYNLNDYEDEEAD